MSSTTSILIGIALVAGGLLWYLFRPDALVIDKTVNEPFPGAERSSMAESQAMGLARSTMGSSAPDKLYS